MQSEGLCKRITARALVFVLSVALVFTMMPLGDRSTAHAAEGDFVVQTPVLVATGTDLVGGYNSVDSVSKEKSWTLDELKGLEGVRGEMYSAKQQKEPWTKSYNIVDGVKVSSLIGDLSQYNVVAFRASDGYAVSFKNNAEEYNYENPGTKNVAGLASGRYYYDGFDTDNPTKKVPVVISWAFDRTEGVRGPQESGMSEDEIGLPPEEKPTAVKDQGILRLFCGQLAEPGRGAEDMNGQLFNGNVEKNAPVQSVIAGDSVDEVVLTVGSKQYTRAEILMMPFAEGTYTYSSSTEEVTDVVRGVPFSVLLDGVEEDATVSFEAADGYDMSSATKTVEELVDGHYMLAYEKNESGIYEEKNGAHGFLTMYGDGAKPSKMITKVTVTTGSGIDFSTSPYKHITNGGQPGSSPYNIDAITGATLTVEGPGTVKSVPVSVRDLEGRDAGAVRAVYTDKREGSDVTRMYEGIDLHYILTKMSNGQDGIKLTDKAKRVLIKNRNRRTIAEFTIDQVEEAHATDTPIIIAYGTSLQDGTNVRPFVFDNATGADSDLGNEDGCIKLVYNKDSITDDTNADYKKFGNMAYIYVAEAETPGYKHDKDPYQSPDISNYVVTVTGDKIGREVNYTVRQLEDMVAYGDDGKPDNNGMGYRDEYSLANSNYWYVNEYEGVQLWKLLLKSGLDPALASDNETLVSSTATDGYPATDKFTIKQVADPNSFGFYEKNPADLNDGSYQGNENLREGNDVSTGDKLRVGYPVLVAYGVNGYPYVEKASQNGYLSGLENDGGPVRIISGKKNYSHANGSSQAKLLDKIVVGDNTNHYSTHKYHSDEVYTDLADNEVTVRILNGADEDAPLLKEKTYKIGDIEQMLYDGSLSQNQMKQAKVKTFYGLAKNGNVFSDLYEGINLNFFLKEVVELPGYKGTITFGNGSNELSLNLEEVLAAENGSNEDTGMTGLPPVLAYGKNGAPMVNSKKADEGYQDKVTLAAGSEYEHQFDVKNNGGPLAVMFPHTDSEVSEKNLSNVTSITINLSPDKYAHAAAPYDSYADYAVTIKGEGTRLGAEGKDFALSELEGKQTIAFTGDYSILKSEGQTPSEARYRGIELYKLLSSSAVGLKSNADKVIVTTSDGKTSEFTLSQIRKSNYINSVTGDDNLPVILAYGAGKAGDADKEDGLPLVAENTDEGYLDAYGNNGGPVRFVMGQTDAEDVNNSNNIKYVKSIEVTASEMTSWNHNSAEVYRQYRDETVQLLVTDKDDNELFNETYTVGEIEDNTALVERVEAKLTQTDTWEGINFWGWIKQEAGSVEGLDNPIDVNVYSADGAMRTILASYHLDGLENGILDGGTYVPILLGYGVNGYPLVIGDKAHPNGEGYVDIVGNNGGPFRMVTHNFQGTSLTYITKIVVKVGDGGTQPEEPADFTIKGVGDKDIKMSVDDIKNLKNKAGDNVGQAEGEYVVKGTTKKVKGALLKNILAAQGVENENAVITLNTPDGFETTGKGASYNNITLKQAIEQNYLLAYQEWDAEAGEWKDIDDVVKNTDIHTNLRMYRNYCEANGLSNQAEWYDECTNITAVTLDIPEVTKFKEYATTGGVRSTWMDGDGTIWVGTYGGGLYSKKAGDSEFSVMNTSSVPVTLQTDFTSAVAADADGGIWVSQNASYTEPGNNQGVLYIKGSSVTQYTVEDNPGTIPNNYVQAIQIGADGKVWMGSFGGLTIYDPAADTWTTYSKNDKEFPATSICTITLDGDGGAWLGFYPDGSGTEADPYAGGFCHITADGTVDKVTPAGGAGDPMFAQSWVRSIAIDQKGTVWAVAAGTNIEDNVGGVIWKWKSDKDTPDRCTGKEVLGDYLDGSATTEVRVVSVDKDGSLWFGTSADGILKVSNPKLTEGKMTVDAQYAKETGSWSSANMNNVYSIDFWNDGTAYVGTAGGLVVLGEEPAGETGEEPAGDATAETADLTITGDALARDGYFTIRGIKNTEGIVKVDANINWLNSSGGTGTSAVQGATLENIIEYIGIAEGAEIDSIEAIGSDGVSKTYTAEQALTEDMDGNKAMFIWTEDEAKVTKVIRGRFSEDDVNKSQWAKNVVRIVVNKKAEEQPVEPAGDATAETADLTITGDALARDGYFTIKGIKNTEGIARVDANINWLNSSGGTGTSAVQGATLENIIEYIGIAEGAEIDSIEAIGSDGVSKTYTAEQALTEDMNGNKAMFIWTEDEAKVTKVIRGRFSEDDVNKSQWAKDVVKIVVNKKTAEPVDTEVKKVEALIEALPAAEDITIESSDAILAARDAYEALSDAEKAEVTNADKLTEALDALDNVVKEGFVEKGETLIDKIDFSAYSASDGFGLWTKINRLETKLANAATAAEAAEIYQQIEDAIASVKTLKQTALENLNEFPVVVTAKSAGYNKVKLSWTKRTSARSYTIYRADKPNGTFKKLKMIQELSFTDKNLKTGKAYYYAVVPGAKVNGEYVYGNPSETVAGKPILSATKVTLKKGKKKATVKWKKVAGASGYVIYRSTKKGSGFKAVKTIKKGSTVSFVNKKLKGKKTYYYKVKAYRLVSGKRVYSKMSAVKAVKTKK